MTFIFLSARFQWLKDDPEIISDVLFAVANVISIARTTYLMPAFEVLGPLQISLGRMMGDITRFLVLFTLVSVTCFSIFCCRTVTTDRQNVFVASLMHRRSVIVFIYQTWCTYVRRRRCDVCSTGAVRVYGGIAQPLLVLRLSNIR